MNSLLRGLIFGSLFGLLSFVGAGADDQEQENALPDIWSAINESKQYHVMFQIQMLNSSQRLTVEEWASFKAGLHRLDLISDSGRTTYLTDAKTGEVFMYRPYSCKLLAKDASELETIANLFRGHPLIKTRNGDGEAETIAHGLGPLWLSAKAEASSVVELPSIQKRNIRIYSVEFKKGNKDFDYTLRFFFNGDYKFVDAIEWISGAARSRKVLVQVRAKVIQMAGNELIGDEIFDLPVGYGCIRSPKYEHPFQVNLGQHRHGVKFLHEGAPNRALLEVALSYPRDATHHSWQTNRYSLSLWRANMKLNELKRSYYVSQVKYRDSASGELVRQRKVWSDTSDSQAAAILYKINPDSGECRVAHVSSAERLRLDFPTSQRDQPAPILISMDLLDWLFNNWEGFHLIREKPSIVSTVLREATYELKMDELRLDAVSKIPIWSGPVSVLKEVSLMPQYVEDPFNKHDDIDLFTSYYTKVTILFYSDDSTQVKYKISLTLFESDDIDLSHIQRQLDISTCIAEQRSETILVKYPIETEEIRARLLESRDVFLESFCANLFSTTPIDPMNANGFEVTFDRFNMLIKFNLLDVPLWQSFQMRTGLSLKKSSVMQEKSTSSLESCAESCGHHNCLRFAFSEKLKRCQLEIGLELGSIETEPSENFVLFESPKLAVSEPWIKLDPNGGKKHLRPHELLDVLRRFVLFFIGDTQEDKKAIEAAASIPLTIKIDQRRDTAKESNNLKQFNFLRPIEIHSSLDDMKEIVRISSATSDEDNKSELVFVRDASKLHAEYSILLADRILSKADKTDEEFTVSSYSECAAYCDNFNCRSFSYCETSNICIVSKISDRDALQRSSRTAFTCTVSVLDYLSKFEPFGLAPAPAKAKKALEGLTELACAQTCIETRDINCQAFYFCAASRSARSKPQVSKCYLEDRHVHDINPLGLDAIAAYQLETGASETKNASAAGGSKMQQSCNFYSRSYLAQFDQFAGKSLDSLKQQQQSMSLLVESSSPSSGPDACARDCVARSCVAFDVCLAEPGKQQASATGENRLQVCRLALHSIKSSDLSSERRGCSTFVLSDHSQFRSPNTTILDWKAQGSQIARDSKVFEALAAKRPNAPAGGASPGEGEIVVDATQKEAEEGDIMRGLMEILSASSAIGERRSIVGGSHWFSRLISVLFGSFLGISCAILWLSRQSQAREQFQWRRFTFGR